MTMHTNNERAQRVESEYKKWEERFVIPFDKEFTVKTLIDLQDQFNNVPLNHTKEKMDLLQMIQRLQSNVNLKEKSKSEVSSSNKVLVVAKEWFTLDEFKEAMNLNHESLGTATWTKSATRDQEEVLTKIGTYTLATYGSLGRGFGVRDKYTHVIDLDKVFTYRSEEATNHIIKKLENTYSALKRPE
ncbi:hypothetical protein ACI2JA_03290 [Alkalihalobacillus sp. NPDC078783]